MLPSLQAFSTQGILESYQHNYWFWYQDYFLVLYLIITFVADFIPILGEGWGLLSVVRNSISDTILQSLRSLTLKACSQIQRQLKCQDDALDWLCLHAQFQHVQGSSDCRFDELILSQVEYLHHAVSSWVVNSKYFQHKHKKLYRHLWVLREYVH